RRHLGDARSGYWAERHGDGLLGLRITDALIDAIPHVTGGSFDEELRGPRLLSLQLDFVVDVSRLAPVIRDRLERAEVILAGRSGQEAAETLEVRVEAARRRAALPEVHTGVVDLPDLDHGVLDRAAMSVQQASAEVRDL